MSRRHLPTIIITTFKNSYTYNKTKYECNERWRCLSPTYIPHPRPQETWIKDEKDAYHIYHKNIPTREQPPHNTWNHWRPHYPKSQKSSPSIQSWGQPHGYRYGWGQLRKRGESRCIQFPPLRPSNPKFRLHPKDGQTQKASQGSSISCKCLGQCPQLKHLLGLDNNLTNRMPFSDSKCRFLWNTKSKTQRGHWDHG